MSAKNGLWRSFSKTPIVIVRRLASPRAIAFGRYPSRAAASRTAWRRAAETFGLSRMTSETSARDTCASRATSSIVTLARMSFLTTLRSGSILALG